MRDEEIVNLVNTCWSDIQKARTMLENDPSLIYARTSINETALMLLLRWYSLESYDINTHINAIEILLEFGADINASNDCGSNTIHNAVLSKEMDIVKYLISKGANINPKCSFLGQSTLHLATLGNSIEMMKYLLENGANINTKDDLGETPLHKTVEEDNKSEFTKLLIQYGADVYAIDECGYTPLDEAYLHGSVLNIRYLLDARASINRITWDDIPSTLFKEDNYMELLKPLL